jgi:Trypsin-like peptidase domain/Tetratricopeptide repeat
VDRRRLADIRAGTADEQRSGGTGYVVGQRLVLTCRHVVADRSGRPWPRLEVWLGHPSNDLRRVAAEVVWVHPDNARDAALLRIKGGPFTGGSLVRWGWFAGPDPLPYTGLGYPDFADYESGRGVEQLGGMLPPLGAGADGAHVLDQGAAPETAADRAWPGMSGTAVFCRGLLTAVVTKDDRTFGNRRLHAVPAQALVGDEEFVHLITEDTGTAPVLEAVELAGFLQPPASPLLARTPGTLLAAAAEAVEFTGRSDELAKLAAWRDSSEWFSLMLVTGEGGQGKTRLARHFAAQARRAGWAAGFLSARATALTLVHCRDQLQAAVDLGRQLQKASRPVLLIADYAETRPDEIIVLADALAGSPTAQPIRMLLLSRTAGAWWDNLTDALGPDTAHRISLESLTESGQRRRDAYSAAVNSLAQRLANLPEPPTEHEPDQPWDALARRLAARPPRLDAPGLGNALTLHVTALTSLLAAAAGRAPTRTLAVGDLIDHERGYLRRAAAKRSLFSPGVLSDLADDDERAAEAWTALERALAGVILIGPCDDSQARVVGMLASESRAGDVVNWLTALYPPSSEGLSLGTVQPDRLAELLLGPILTRQADLLCKIGALAKTAGDAYAALFTLTRTAAHPGFGRIDDQVADLIATQAGPFAVAAPVLAATLPRVGALRDGLLRLGRDNPQAFQRTVSTVLAQLPELSVSGALFSAALTNVITGILRPLARDNTSTYLPQLAAQLVNLCNRLSQAGQRQAALATAREAAEIYRRLVAESPDAYLPDLAIALTNLGAALTDVGQRQEAFALGQQITGIYRQLAAASPDQHLAGLAMALTNLSLDFGQAGQYQTALATAREATDIYRQLAKADPGHYLPGLAMALNSNAVHLAVTEQLDAALPVAAEATDIYRQLAAANPDAYLPDLALALTNQGKRLGEARQLDAALPVAAEATDIYRQLAAANPDAYLPDLALALINQGFRLDEARETQAAFTVVREALDIYRQAAAVNPEAHLLRLSMALIYHGEQLVKAGEKVEAGKIWEGALADLPEGSSRLALTVEYAKYLINHQEPIAGVELLLGTLITPRVPGWVEVAARRLLRAYWRQHPEYIDQAWKSATSSSTPGWIYLTDDHIKIVIDWVMARTWAESHRYFQHHAADLSKDSTVIVLDELSLAAPEKLIGQYLRLLKDIREQGLDATYGPLMLSDTFGEWMQAPNWEASASFLHDHSELLDEDVPDSAVSPGEDPDPIVIVHQALLILAKSSAGVEGAYRTLKGDQFLEAMIAEAIEARDAAQINAAAKIEMFVLKRSLAGALHTILAWLLAGPVEQLPETWATQLRTLAVQTNQAHRETILLNFNTALSGISANNAVVCQVRDILSLNCEP